ncbi:cytochrome-c peroxidase [Bradyrhizobium sp. WSM1253]|uniref:cytochrome-c peroxidase n=1 Tax=Bradyrhizobium sp. WSM1253 TaxID=319003 RepID=UPI0002E4B440|nr:cytochrome-c peroxidase [Bradyrhizobium sp. WSM1253]
MNMSIPELRLVAEASILAIGLLMSSGANAGDDLMRNAKQIFHPIPSVIPAVKDNPVTHGKVELGKMLFFDPRLSASGIISCNTCHNLGTGGVDAGPTSVGHGWKVGLRRAPTVYNAVFNAAQFWDGRAADLKASHRPCAGECRNECDSRSCARSLELNARLCRLVQQRFSERSETGHL